MQKLLERMIRAAKLDATLYEEVEADKGAFRQAIIVVLISSAAAGLGSVTISGFQALIFGSIFSLAGWYIWAYLTYFIGTKLLPEAQTKTDPGELLRTIGFSSSPGVLRVLGIIPGFSSIIFPVAGIWMLVAMVIAVRQALDYKSTGRAVGVCLIGWIIQAVIYALLVAVFIGPRMAPSSL
ncbi:MAG: YIP1 family protein [Candidatus Omnitrophota bacterium]